jgi:hypothetical protein
LNKLDKEFEDLNKKARERMKKHNPELIELLRKSGLILD